MFDLKLAGENAKKASFNLNKVNEKDVNNALNCVADALTENKKYLKEQNAIDVENAKKNGKSEGFIDRLVLSDKVIDSMAEGIREVALLKSPLDKTIYKYNNKKQGIKIVKKTVPFGVIGIIFEARPNVCADAFALCFKTKNAVILKGGSDAINSNIAVVSVIRKALNKCGIDENAVSLIEDTERKTALEFMKMNEFVDLLIPRGGASLIRSAIENSTIPIIQTGLGNCHVYVDEYADIDKAVKIIFNAKTQRYGVCNACESLLIHSAVLSSALPLIYDKLQEKKVQLRVDDRAYKVLDGKENVILATDEDFYTEYGDAIISVKTVDGVDEAVKLVNQCGTHHTDSIVTEKTENAEKFMQGVDSTTVCHNASTRFTDGFVFGLGAEIGISTQKLHARGPMGLNELTTTKFFVCDKTKKGAVRI